MRRHLLALLAAAVILLTPGAAWATVATEAPSSSADTIVATIAPGPDTTPAADVPAGSTTAATEGPTDSTTPATTTPLLDDPNGCGAVVWDPEGQLRNDPRVAQQAERLRAQGYDVHVRVEAAPDGTIDDRLGQLERICAGWTVDGDRAPGLLVVMVVPSQRRTGIWYGSRSGALADWWERIQTDEMNPRFRSGDYAGGLADGLDAVTGLLLDGRTPSASSGAAFPTLPIADDGESDGGGGSAAWAWALLLLGGGFGLLVWIKGLIDGSAGLDGSRTGGGGSSPRRSFGGWSSSSSSRRSSSSRSSSSRSSGGSRRSGGSGRSGGGSTSW